MTLHFMAAFWQRTGRDWRVIVPCRARGYDRPSQRPGRIQSYGYTERSGTLLEAGKVAWSLRWGSTGNFQLAFSAN